MCLGKICFMSQSSGPHACGGGGGGGSPRQRTALSDVGNTPPRPLGVGGRPGGSPVLERCRKQFADGGGADAVVPLPPGGVATVFPPPPPTGPAASAAGLPPPPPPPPPPPQPQPHVDPPPLPAAAAAGATTRDFFGLAARQVARDAYEHAQATGVVTSSVASDRLDEASLRSWAAALYLMEGGEETPPRAERQGRARSPRFAARRRCLLTPPPPPPFPRLRSRRLALQGDAHRRHSALVRRQPPRAAATTRSAVGRLPAVAPRPRAAHCLRVVDAGRRRRHPPGCRPRRSR